MYEGYFGAGAGVLMLALTLLTVESSLLRANALKNALLGIADVVGAVLFACFGPVRWIAAVALGVGFAMGGTLGPGIVRRVRPDLLRLVIATAAFALAGWLLVQALTLPTPG